MAWKKTVLGIEFVSTTFTEFLEALAVLQWTMMFGYASTIIFIILIALLTTPFAVVTVVLIAWVIYDYRTPERGGRQSKWIRGWPVWRYCRRHFPVSLRRTTPKPFDPSRNYLFIYHPHGILSYGAFVNFATDAGDFGKLFPGMKSTILGLRIQFMAPLIREYFMALGMTSLFYFTTSLYVTERMTCGST